MADTAIAITAGTGTNVDTRTEATNGNHRQVVVLGDPSTNAGVAAVDATNGLSVNVTNASLTVGAHAVTQSGTWTVQPGNTANTTAWKVDGSAVNQPVNPISGQTGVAGGSGVVGATTQRVVIASDTVNANGRAADASSAPVALSTENVAILGATNETAASTDTATAGLNGRLQRLAQRLTSLIALMPATYSEYETVAASATAQALGASGATGDYISGLLVIPATTSPGNVLLLDNATSITVFTGGATSVSNLVPFYIPLNMTSVSGAWKVTTGTNVSVIGIGNFT